MTDDVQESLLDRKVEKGAEKYFRRYRSQCEALSASPLAKARTLTPYDYYALGKQLENWDRYKEMCTEDGTLANLGKIPNIAYDVITVGYGASPLSVMASTQPIDEEQGMVYFKEVIASTTRGSHTAGNMIFDPRNGGITPLSGYSSDRVVQALGNTAGGTQSYSGNINNTPLRTQRVKISIPTLNLTAVDNGEGFLIGYDIQGTINYSTGAYTIALANDPAGVHAIVAESSTSFEGAPDIPRINLRLAHKQINAIVFALKDTVGLEQSYAMRRRFGLIAEDEITNDLVAAINSEMVSLGIAKLSAAAVGNTNFTKAAPASVSDFEHRMSFKFKIAEAESTLLGNAGRGSIKVMVAGLNVCSIISTLPGFRKIADGNDIGPHIYGELDGVIVIRVHNPQILSADQMLCLHKGASPFDASLVWSPYMPLVVTNALPTGANPLMSQKAAAIWGGMDVVVPNFVTRLTLV